MHMDQHACAPRAGGLWSVPRSTYGRGALTAQGHTLSAMCKSRLYTVTALGHGNMREIIRRLQKGKL